MISPVNIAELICILCNSGCCLTNFIYALMLTIIGPTLVRLFLITFNSLKSLTLIMVRTETPMCDFGQPAIDFDLAGTDGRNWTLQDCRGDNGTLIMFICNHCPFVKAIHERLVRDTRELLELGVSSVAIMPNEPADYPEDSFDNMIAVAKQFNFPFPYLFDEGQQTARDYGAVCTPDFFGHNADMTLQYRGRPDAGRLAAPPDGASSDLFDAMRQIANSGKGPQKQIASMGCSIKWRG